MNPDLDGSFFDWIPVWSEKEADLLNIFLDSHELPGCLFRHLRSNNDKYCWIGVDRPRPMDLPELARAIAMKYVKALLSPSNEDYKTDSQIDEDVWQEVQKNLPQVNAMAEEIFKNSSDDMKASRLILDNTDDEETKQINEIAVTIDTMMRSDDIGFDSIAKNTRPLSCVN